MTNAFIAVGFVFDHALHEDVGPLENLLGLPLAGSTLGAVVEVQSQMRGGKVAKATSFDWKRVASAITTGAATWVDIRRRVPAPERSQLEFCADCVSPVELAAHRAGAPESVRPYRYEGLLQIGTDFLDGVHGVDRLLEDVLDRWMSRITLRAGVAVAASTLDFAGGIARGAGGMPGTELDRRARALWIASRGWGPLAREPEWGTYLTRAHVDAIGGTGAIEREVQPYRVLEHRGIVYVQLTPYDQALLPVTEERRARLETLMRPILAQPLSRAWRRDPEE